MTNRQHAIRIMNRLCLQMAGVSLNDLPDLPCVMNAVDEMEEIIEAEGSEASMSELLDIAQEGLTELLEEEGFPI